MEPPPAITHANSEGLTPIATMSALATPVLVVVAAAGRRCRFLLRHLPARQLEIAGGGVLLYTAGADTAGAYLAAVSAYQLPGVDVGQGIVNAQSGFIDLKECAP